MPDYSEIIDAIRNARDKAAGSTLDSSAVNAQHMQQNVNSLLGYGDPYNSPEAPPQTRLQQLQGMMYGSDQDRDTRLAEAGASDPRALWSRLGQADAALSGAPARGVDAWVGGPIGHNSDGGVMVPGPLERLPTETHEAMGEAVRPILREHYGDTVPVYRAEGPEESQATGRQFKLKSYTTDPAVAEHFAGVQPELPVHDVGAIMDTLRRTGEATLPSGLSYFRDLGNPNYVDIIRHGQHVTNTHISSIPDDIREMNEYAAERAADNVSARARIKSYDLPVDNVVHATDRFGQREIIAYPPKSQQ